MLSFGKDIHFVVWIVINIVFFDEWGVFLFKWGLFVVYLYKGMGAKI